MIKYDVDPAWGSNAQSLNDSSLTKIIKFDIDPAQEMMKSDIDSPWGPKAHSLTDSLLRNYQIWYRSSLRL